MPKKELMQHLLAVKSQEDMAPFSHIIAPAGHNNLPDWVETCAEKNTASSLVIGLEQYSM